MARADDKITLKLDVEPGQVWKFDRSYEESLNATAQANGQTQTNENKNHQHRVGMVEILSARNGKPTSARMTFGPRCETTTELDGESRDVPFAFKGQTITVTRGEDGTVQSDFHGQADSNSLSELSAAIDPDLSLYPEGQVAVGDEWKASDAIVHKQLGLNGPNDTGQMKYKLISVKDLNGRSTAEVAVDSEASLDLHGVLRKTHSTGTALIDVKTGHVMKFDLTGTSSIGGTAMNQGSDGQAVSVRWSGDGTMRLSLTSETGNAVDRAAVANTTATPIASSAAAPAASPPAASPPAASPPAATPDNVAAAPSLPQNPLAPQQASPTVAAAQPAAGGAAKQLRLESHTLMDDPSYIGGEVWRFLVPAGWKTEGGMQWDLTSSYPAQLRLRMFDPDSAEAIELDPLMAFTWQPNQTQFGRRPQQGSKYAGGIFEPPVRDVFSAIVNVVVPIYYKDLVDAKARIVEQEQLPKLAQLARSQMIRLNNVQQNATAGRVRFEYDANGQTVQEDIYAAMTMQVNQQFNMMNWNIPTIISERAPKGMLDQVKTYRLVMQGSITPNLQWYNKLFQLAEAANQQKIREIQAIGERSRIFAEMTNEVSDQRRQQFEDYQRSTSASALAVDQYIRDVTPYNSTSGQPVELPNAYSHAWQATNGQYLMTNDPTYNPAADPNFQQTGWTEIQPQH